ncbi:MAG: hypothetical protein GX892_14490 [Thermoanaerobacteraceae bacterium]|nr:hypothetical protein [Thermoanaerobacteraceae bacterium]
MFTKISAFITNTIKNHMAILIPIVATAVGFILKAYYERGGIGNMFRRFRHNKKRVVKELVIEEAKLEIEEMKLEEAKRELLFKKLNHLNQAINALKQEFEETKDEEIKNKYNEKIQMLEQKKKELLLEEI